MPGASSGIGEATVRALAAAGFETVAAARRVERCEALAAEVHGRALALDVTDPESVETEIAARGLEEAIAFVEPVAYHAEESYRRDLRDVPTHVGAADGARGLHVHHRLSAPAWGVAEGS